MKKILFLSSAFIMTTLGAYAADGIITGGAGTCTVDVLGVSDNNATANTIATWSLNDYECGAGQYLDEDTLTCTTCPAGSYCPGGTFTIENASSGTFDCPAGYTESVAGAGAQTQCYTTCTVATANIAHATAVSGNNYYGTTDADTCIATDCELGYHVDDKLEFYEKTPLVPVDHQFFSYSGASMNAFGEFFSDSFPEAELTENNTWANKMGDDIVYGRASCQSKRHNEELRQELSGYFEQVKNGLMTLEEYQSAVASVTDPGIAKFMAEALKSYLEIYGDKATNENFSETYMYIIFNGEKNYIIFDKVFDVDYSTSSSGKYCYCQLTDFVPAGGNKEPIVSAPWVKKRDFESSENCASSCAYYCSGMSQGDDMAFSGYTAALFDAMDYRTGDGMCKITENNCPAGQYLAVVGDAMMCVPCKSGSYCPGGVYTIESENKGTELCPSGYPNSDAGAGADTQCYKACTLDTANIAHATAVSGNDYYGTGTDTCSATACATGYHTEVKIQFVEKTPAVNVDFDTVNGVAVIDGTGWSYNVDLPNAGLTENNTIAVSFSNGIMYGRASCQPSMDTGMEYMMNNMDAVMDGSMSVEDFRAGLEPLMGVTKTDFAIDLLNRVQSGTMSMDVFMAVFLSDKNTNYSTSSTGQYCYFQVNGFAPSGGTKSDIVGLPWMLYPEPFESADECASNCIMTGTESVLQFAPVAFGALDYVDVAICAANTINIDWNPDNGGTHTQNMCTYDGAITLPDEPVKVGYTFSGWKLVEPNSTPVQ